MTNNKSKIDGSPKFLCFVFTVKWSGNLHGLIFIQDEKDVSIWLFYVLAQAERFCVYWCISQFRSALPVSYVYVQTARYFGPIRRLRGGRGTPTEDGWFGSFLNNCHSRKVLRAKFWATDKSAEGTLEACEKVCIVLLYQAARAKGEVSWLRGWQIRDGSSEESPKQVELSALHHGEKSVCTYTNNSLVAWNWERG